MRDIPAIGFANLRLNFPAATVTGGSIFTQLGIEMLRAMAELLCGESLKATLKVMKTVQLTITLVTLYLLFFQMAPHLEIPAEAITYMFIVSPFLVVLMVYVVLKYGQPSKYTFDERFYDDLDYERNGKE